jgi:hypothetical protein
MDIDLSSLKELGIGLGALLILLAVVKIFTDNLAGQRADFCKIIGNHVDHNTQAILKLDATIEKNTEVLIKLDEKMK